MLADDLGWDDLSFNGNRIVETHHIDKFARNSVNFSKFYVNPVCAPTRASLLTGRHFLRTGVSHVHGGKEFLALDETTIADVLKNNGYKTGMWGKWHNGKTDGYFPWQRGFQEAYKAKLYKHNNSWGSWNGKELKHKKWTTEVITDYAINFIEENQDKPFFAYLPYLNCHEPLNAPPKYVNKYKSKNISDSLATLYGMIDHLDTHFQRLLNRVEELGLADNTIIMFLSDNGPAVLNNALTDEDREIRYVNDLKGHKGNIWENGVRTPFYVQWGHNLKPKIVDRLVDLCDIFPTIMDLAGIDTEELEKPLDGRSIKEYLLGNTAGLPPKFSFNYANPAWPPTDKPWSPKGIKDEYRPIPPDRKEAVLKFEDQIISVQNEKYKLLQNPGTVDIDLVEGYALYNIDEDPRQTNNIILQKPEVAQELKDKLREWWQGILGEKNSFRMPVFQIGRKKNSKVLAYGAWRQSENVKTGFNFSYNWTKSGAFAEYKINVLKPGVYSVYLKHNSSKPSKAKMAISNRGNKITGIVEDSDRFKIGDMELDIGESFLRLELIDISAKFNGSAFGELKLIEFIKK
jgi:arylsulfatase A-like enzyme